LEEPTHLPITAESVASRLLFNERRGACDVTFEWEISAGEPAYLYLASFPDSTMVLYFMLSIPSAYKLPPAWAIFDFAARDEPLCPESCTYALKRTLFGIT